MNTTSVSIKEPTIQKQLLSYATRLAELTLKEQKEYIQLLTSLSFNELSPQQQGHLNMYLRGVQQRKILKFLEMLQRYQPQKLNFLRDKVSLFFNTIDSQYITGDQREEIKRILNATPDSIDISNIKKLLDFIQHMKDEEMLDSHFIPLDTVGRKIYDIRIMLETYALENPTEYSSDYRADYMRKMDISVLMGPVVSKYFKSAKDKGHLDELSILLMKRIREDKNQIYLDVLQFVGENAFKNVDETDLIREKFKLLFSGNQSDDIIAQRVKSFLELVFSEDDYNQKTEHLKEYLKGDLGPVSMNGGARKSKKQKRKSNNSKKRKSNNSKKRKSNKSKKNSRN